MLKKSILRVSPMVLLTMLLTGVVQAQDPNLIGRWTFDEGAGTIAHDASAHGNDGTLNGDPQWVLGYLDKAVKFDGSDDYVDCGNGPSLDLTTWTIAFWLDVAQNKNYNAFVVKGVDAAENYEVLGFADGSMHLPIMFRDGTRTYVNTPTGAIVVGEWSHFAYTYNSAKGRRFYKDSKLIFSDAASGTPRASTEPLTIGNERPLSRFVNGTMDEVRIYNRVLTDAEIKTLAARPKAYNPQPPDGATGVTLPYLKWSPSTFALWHRVYLGATPNLTEADRKARQTLQQAMYYALTLEPGVTYYWRIDEEEAGAKVRTGDVWSFTMAPVSAYGPTPRNGDKWIDPNSDLTWLPGTDAMAHDVYFSTDKNLVAARDSSAKLGDRQLVSTLELPKLEAGTTYYWLVDEYDSMDAMHEGEVWSFTTNVPGTGGVKAEYFRNMSVTGAPFLTQIEPSIDHAWGDPGGPVAGVVDQFSARWTADLEIAVGDTYTFITTSDDGARLWLNDVQIINGWVDQGTTDWMSEPQKLEPGIYSLRMEYYENTGGAVAQLSWQTPTVARQIIPAGPLQPPVRAKAIYPKDNDVNVPQDLTLMWSTGEKAVTHDVYFGEDEAAVAAATPADASIYKGSLTLETNFWSPGALEWGKTYYWRIDEVNAASSESPWKGAAWSFTTANFLVIDDFESYTDEVTGRVFQTWIDGWGYTEPAPGDPGNGTGSTVGYSREPFSEHSIVHSGGSSMPLAFNNADSPFYSETERTFDSPQNWTVNGVNTLCLYVRGYPEVNAVPVTETGGKMTLAGDGADIWNASDDFTFAYKPLNGDATIVARVVSVGAGSNTWAKGGVMIRDGLDGDSASAQMVLTANSDGTAGNGAAFQNRATAGLDMGTNDATSNTTATLVIAPPYWVKIERIGDTFTGYTSPDGSAWTMVGTQDVVMTAPVCIGICVTSHAAGEQRTFQFESIKTTGSVTGQWQGAVIASPKYNSVQDFYVAVQDSSNKLAVVTNATAVNATDWTEVQMPLSSFTGVNMTKVKKMTIGVGNRNNPLADGTGMLFIDDIRVIKP